MTFVKVTGTAAVLFFAAIMPAYGQKEGKEEPQQHAPQAQQPQQHAQPAQQPQRQAQPPQQHAQPAKAPAQQAQQHAQPAKAPAQEPQHAQQAKAPAQQAQQHAQPARAPAQQHTQASQQQPPHTTQQVQSWQQQRGWASHGGAWQAHTSFQQGRDQNWASDHRDWSQRGGYGGYYIPQASFGLYFGDSHFFHIGVMPVMYMGYPRFAYGGFSFLLVDPWPGSWQENWYVSDDVYIDYDSGYYMYDRRYPGVRLAVTVAL